MLPPRSKYAQDSLFPTVMDALAYYGGRRLNEDLGLVSYSPLAILTAQPRRAPVCSDGATCEAVSYALFARGCYVTRAASLEDAQPKPEI